MKVSQIIGRDNEKKILNQILESNKSEFLALYGRRRVGKTFLIKHYFDKQSCIYFYSSGIQNGSLQVQLEEFSLQIGKTFYGGAAIKSHRRWRDAFEELTKAINQIPSSKKIVIFFDELPWMSTPRSGLLQALDYYWNRYWSHDTRFKLIVCGSSASWIKEKIINNKGGLYNRVTRTIFLEPFDLKETNKYLYSQSIDLNHKQVLDLYMVLGGIPHYLSLVRKGISSHQCIDELCFQKGGALTNEFDRLFASLFKDSEVYINLIRVIAKFPRGIGQASLIKKSGSSSGGNTVKKLNELKESGFIMEFIPYGHQEKGVYYKIVDEFTLFYLRWIEKKKGASISKNKSKGYWLALSKTPSWNSWAGYAFESICYKHISNIRNALDISVGAEIGSWRYVPRLSSQEGTEIDLLFDRDDGVITICEIKYNTTQFTIDKRYSKILMNKINVYKQQTRTKKQIFLTMITVNGVKKSSYSESLLSMVTTLEDLFN